MRTLLIGALAASLVGCSCFVSQQAGVEACTGGNGFACFDRTAMGQATEPEPPLSDPNSARPKIKSKVAAKTPRPSSAHGREKTHLVTQTAKPTATAAKVEPSGPDQPSEAPDQIVAQAKITVAAKLEDPASAEFGEMKRAMRTNTLGQSVDTICGRVKGKKASGEATEDRPFLYLVKDNEAYVVEGPPTSAAATAYRNICY
jgi:hypothetical protein